MELHIDRLTKSFGAKLAVDRLSATLETGIYCILGPNGSGKTTLLRMIATVLRQTSGEILLDGKNITDLGAEYRDRLGYMPQKVAYYGHFTPLQYLDYVSALKGLDPRQGKRKARELLSLMHLDDVENKKMKTFSGGMLQRIGIAQALLNEPDILILDEPSSGLDPQERIHLRQIISELGNGRLVFLSTHIVADVEHIAKEIMIIKKGQLIHQGTTAAMLQTIENKVWTLRVPTKTNDRQPPGSQVVNTRHDGAWVEMRLLSDEKPHNDAVLAAPGLEDLYLSCFPEDLSEVRV